MRQPHTEYELDEYRTAAVTSVVLSITTARLCLAVVQKEVDFWNDKIRGAESEGFADFARGNVQGWRIVRDTLEGSLE